MVAAAATAATAVATTASCFFFFGEHNYIKLAQLCQGGVVFSDSILLMHFA